MSKLELKDVVDYLANCIREIKSHATDESIESIIHKYVPEPYIKYAGL